MYACRGVFSFSTIPYSRYSFRVMIVLLTIQGFTCDGIVCRFVIENFNIIQLKDALNQVIRVIKVLRVDCLWSYVSIIHGVPFS